MILARTFAICIVLLHVLQAEAQVLWQEDFQAFSAGTSAVGVDSAFTELRAVGPQQAQMKPSCRVLEDPAPLSGKAAVLVNEGAAGNVQLIKRLAEPLADRGVLVISFIAATDSLDLTPDVLSVKGHRITEQGLLVKAGIHDNRVPRRITIVVNRGDKAAPLPGDLPAVKPGHVSVYLAEQTHDTVRYVAAHDNRPLISDDPIAGFMVSSYMASPAQRMVLDALVVAAGVDARQGEHEVLTLPPPPVPASLRPRAEAASPPPPQPGQAPPTKPRQPGDNLLANGGFELAEGDKPAHWTPFGNPGLAVRRVTDPVKAGQAAVQVQVEPEVWAGVQSELIVLNQSTVVPMQIRYWAYRDQKHGGGPNYMFGASLQANYADGTTKLETPPQLWLDPNATGWTQVSAIWTPLRPLAALRLRLMPGKNGPTLFDDVQLLELSDETLRHIKQPGMQPVSHHERFDRDGVMPDWLLPHLGDWQVRSGVLSTAGPMPDAGWYLRSRYQYQARRIAFRVRKDDPAGIVFVHLRHWRLLLRPDGIMVQDVASPVWWRSFHRPIRFADTHWHDFELRVAHDHLQLIWDGEALAAYRAPRHEWQGKPYADVLANQDVGFVTADEVFVLHAHRTGMQIDDLQLQGVQMGQAEGFIESVKYQGPFIKDNDFERLAPREPVVIKGALPDREKPAVSLPPVTGFSLSNRLPERQPQGQLFYDLYVGDSVSPMPTALFHPRFNAPVWVTIHVNLAAAGVYTLKIPVVGAKNLANVLEVVVDGRAVSREVYRGLNSTTAIGLEGALDYVPLQLEAGYHRIALRFSPELLDKIHNTPSMPPAGSSEYRMPGSYWKYGRIGLGTVELVQGLHRPQWTLSAARPQMDVALDQPAEDTEWFSKVIAVRVTDLPDGEAVVRLGFKEVVLDSPGDRLMDIAINEQVVARGFDVVAEAGADMTYIERDWPATVRDGELWIELTGRNFQAMLNYLEIRQHDRAVFRHNAGWTPSAVPWGFYASYSNNENHRLVPHDPAQHDQPMPAFEGHNVVGNPSFTHLDRDGKLLAWRSVRELREQLGTRDFNFSQAEHDAPGPDLFGIGEYGQDTGVYHSQPASLRVGATQGALALTTATAVVNHTKRQRWTILARSEGATGTARAALYFFAADYFHDSAGHGPRLLGRAVSNFQLTGTQDWTTLTVDAVPPHGTALAAIVLEIENNTAGTFWFDDGMMDGYGSEPLEITLSHLGFHPRGNKRILVKSLTPEAVRYRITDADGRIVLEGEALPAGRTQYPDRHYHAIDATSLALSGQYTVVAQQGDRHRATESFRIDEGIYEELTGLLLRGIEIKQFNVDIPGYHGPTHLDDQVNWVQVFPRFDHQVKLLSRGVNTIGGYYDAGDEIKHWDGAPVMAFGAWMASEMLARRDAQAARRALDLALVGFDSMVDVQLPDGHFFKANKPYQYDSIPCYGIERYARDRHAEPRLAGLFARLALQLRKSDPQRSAAYQQAAERVYRITRSTWQSQSMGRERLPFNQLRLPPKMMLACVYLYQLTGDEAYRQELDRQIDDYVAAMRQRAYLEPGYQNYGELTFEGAGGGIVFDILWAPTFLLQEMPDHPKRQALVDALLLLVEDIGRVSSVEPWQQALALQHPEAPHVRWPNMYPLNYWTTMAFGLSRLAMLLQRRDLALLAERQLQWALGHNPFDVAMVHGVGDRYVAGGDMLYTQPEFYLRQIAEPDKRWLVPGNVPTMAFRTKGNGEIHYVRSGLWGPIMGGPAGLPLIYLQADYPSHPAPTEYWQPYAGNFCAAAAAVADALQQVQP